MKNLQKTGRDRAFCLLRWAAFALRRLTVCEITEAVLLDENSEEFPVDELPDSVDEGYIVSEIFDLCGSLLEVRSNPAIASAGTRTIHLAHFSVRQYLVHAHLPSATLLVDETLRVSHEIIENTKLAKLCLRYITFPLVWHVAERDQPGPLVASFREYAAASWYLHAIAGELKEVSIMNNALAFLDTSNCCWHAWRKWFAVKDGKLEAPTTAESLPPRPLYYALKLDLLPLAIE